MASLKSIPCALALGVCLAGAALALDTSKLQPRGYVNDFAHALDPRSAQALEAYCANLERVTGVQMAIVTVDSLDDEPIEDAANRLYRQWGVGKKGKDEGLMLLLAIKDRKQRAEVGYGLEPIITDADAGAILRGIRPILRQGNYGGALVAAAQEFGNQIAQQKGVALDPARPAGDPAPRPNPGGFLPVVFIIIIAILVMRRLARGGGGGGWGGGGGTGFLTGMMLGNLMSRRGGWGGGGFGGYDGGGGWGGGGGGFGGGGFGGFGGGDSGGGGASSGW